MSNAHGNSPAVCRRSFGLSLLLAFSALSASNGFIGVIPSKSHEVSHRHSSALKAGFLDNLRKKGQSLTTTTTALRVQKPENFVVPEPKPLQIPESTDLGKFTKNTLALAFRLGVSAFVLGWKIDTLFYKDENGDEKKYSLSLGPLSVRDSSSVMNADVPRPEKPLILYEYDASPYCKRVREFINLLDLTVEYRPCPGARQGKFSDELFEKTGRRTVS